MTGSNPDWPVGAAGWRGIQASQNSSTAGPGPGFFRNPRPLGLDRLSGTSDDAYAPSAPTARLGQAAGQDVSQEIEIDYGSDVRHSAVSNYALGVLKDILRAAGLRSALVTRASPVSAPEARTSKGSRVGVGPEVVEVDPSSIHLHQEFVWAVKQDRRVVRFVCPPASADYHLEIQRVEPTGVEPPLAAPAPPPLPSKEQDEAWFEVRFVLDPGGEPVTGLKLQVKLPDGYENLHTTDTQGKIRIDNIKAGECKLRCDLEDAVLASTVSYVGKDKPSSGELNERKGASLFETRWIATVQAHKVKTGETLESLAQAADLTWQQLARFNWETEEPGEINQRLHDEVGCTNMTVDRQNYLFNDTDEPGLVYIPSRWQLGGLATTQAHVVRVKQAGPFMILLENDQGLRIPEAAYEATFADGSVKKGALGKSGIALIKDPPPGPVLVAYPDQDDVAAKSLAASARKSFDDHDPQEVYRVLEHSPQLIKQTIRVYDQYFNDYTGKGFVEDVYQDITDPDALMAVVGMLASAGIQTHEQVKFFEWQEDEES